VGIRRCAQVADGVVSGGDVSCFTTRDVKTSDVCASLFCVNSYDCSAIRSPNRWRAAAAAWCTLISCKPTSDVIVEVGSKTTRPRIWLNVHDPKIRLSVRLYWPTDRGYE